MVYYYKVANLYFSLVLAAEDKLNEMLTNYEPFKVGEDESDRGVEKFGDLHLFSLQVEMEDKSDDSIQNYKDIKPLVFFEREDGDMAFYSDNSKASKDVVNDYDIIFYLPNNHDEYGVFKAREGFKKGYLNANGRPYSRHFCMQNALMMLYAFSAAPRRTLLQHASVIKKGDYAYLFLGVSGTGKSTHSRLWLKNIEGAELLNDDNPVIRVDNDNQVYVFGSPWSGKTPCYKQDVAKLGAFVMLKQAPENKIEKLSGVLAYINLFTTFSNMKWEPAINENIVGTTTFLLDNCRIFHLECLPDNDAALLCHKTISVENSD